MGDYVRHALQQGLYGWPVSDCVVTLATCSYSVPDGPPSRRGPLSTAADFRKLTPIVVRQALQCAGTVVCEPVERVGLEIPVDAIGVVNATLGRFGASIEAHASTGKLSTVRAVLPTARAHDLQRQLPALTNGEGVLEASFAGYRPVSGPQPARPSRRDQSPA
jgi:ribosomal protection tetracycline resistance protein